MEVLTRELAQSIVERTMKIINKNINVMNHEGIIIGSGDASRIGEVHDGALQVIKHNARIDIDEQQVKQLKGTKPGVNSAIIFQGDIAGVIGITGSPTEVGNYSELVKMAAELILEQAFLTEQMQWEDRLKEDMVNQLILGNPLEDPLFKERARRIGIDLTRDRVAVVIEFSSTSSKQLEIGFQKIWSKIHPRLANILSKEDLLVRTSPYELVILKSVRIQNKTIDHSYMKQIIKEIITHLSYFENLTVKAALGKHYLTTDKLQYSYETAKETLKVGKVLSPDDSVYLYQDYALPVLLSEVTVPEKHMEMVERFETLMTNDTKGELLDTLQSYVQENGDITKTAKRLFIHRNTLGYRLNRISELTNRDPRKVHDLMELYMAMILFKLG